MGTKAKTMLLISTEFRVSSGPDGHRQRIGPAVRSQQIGHQGDAHHAQHVARQHSSDERQSAPNQRAFHGARQHAFGAQSR